MRVARERGVRVAVCLSGEMRNCPNAIDRLKRNVLKPFKAAGAEVDLIVQTRLDACWKAVTDLPRLRMLRVERNVVEAPDDILSPANPPERGMDESLPSRRAFLYQSYLQYYRSLRGVAELKRRAEEQDGAPYDWVLRARPDISIAEPMDVGGLQPGFIHFPENDRWHFHGMETLSDKFAVGPSREMDAYFDRRALLKEWCGQYGIHAEALVAWQMEKLNLPWRFLPGLRVVRDEDIYEHSWRPDREGW